MGWFGRKKETLRERIEREFNEKPFAYPGLSHTNIKEYTTNLDTIAKVSDKDKPLEELIRVYPPLQMTRTR